PPTASLSSALAGSRPRRGQATPGTPHPARPRGRWLPLHGNGTSDRFQLLVCLGRSSTGSRIPSRLFGAVDDRLAHTLALVLSGRRPARPYPRARFERSSTGSSIPPRSFWAVFDHPFDTLDPCPWGSSTPANIPTGYLRAGLRPPAAYPCSLRAGLRPTAAYPLLTSRRSSTTRRIPPAHFAPVSDHRRMSAGFLRAGHRPPTACPLLRLRRSPTDQQPPTWQPAQVERYSP